MLKHAILGLTLGLATACAGDIGGDEATGLGAGGAEVCDAYASGAASPAEEASDLAYCRDCLQTCSPASCDDDFPGHCPTADLDPYAQCRDGGAVDAQCVCDLADDRGDYQIFHQNGCGPNIPAGAIQIDSCANYDANLLVTPVCGLRAGSCTDHEGEVYDANGALCGYQDAYTFCTASDQTGQQHCDGGTWSSCNVTLDATAAYTNMCVDTGGGGGGGCTPQTQAEVCAAAGTCGNTYSDGCGGTVTCPACDGGGGGSGGGGGGGAGCTDECSTAEEWSCQGTSSAVCRSNFDDDECLEWGIYYNNAPGCTGGSNSCGPSYSADCGVY